MKLKVLTMVVAAGLGFAAGAVGVENVSATQRWPWNNLVDVDYEITGAADGDEFVVELTATSAGGAKTYKASTYRNDPIGLPGQNRLTWDLGADYPEMKADDFEITVSAKPFVNSATEGVYLVIDLSSGASSAKYPVRYTTVPPVHSKNAPDVCKTTEMWMKRVKKGSYPFWGTDTNHGTGIYTVRLTKDLYAGLFECTQQQWFQVTGKWPAKFSNETWRATRPVESINQGDTIGTTDYPTYGVQKSSFVGKVRQRTGLKTFNLPTEGQWEYVCRAGRTQSSIVPAGKTLDDIARYWHGEVDNVSDYSIGPEEHGTACVGSFLPNNWGFYDVCGNVSESALDAGISNEQLQLFHAAEIEATGYVTDPQSPPNRPGSGDIYAEHFYWHVYRGGGYDNSASRCSPYDRLYPDSQTAPHLGARFYVTCE